MTPEAARAAIDAARAQVARAVIEMERTHRVDGVGTRMSGVARDRLAVAERAQALAELTARRVGLTVGGAR
jgi:hypothetical protein